MKIIFLGTSNISLPSLKALIASGHEVAAVITQPDKESGRGRKISFSPVKEEALKNNIRIFQPEKVGKKEVLDALSELSPDLFVLVSFSQMIPEALCDIAPYGCINLHPSLLPKYRGAGPIRGPILNGDKTGGVTIMQISPEMDAGDILLQREIPLDPKETLRTYEEKAAKAGALLMLEAVDKIEDGTVTYTPQDHTKATYLKKISKEDGLIDFSRPAVLIERQIRACDPWPSAFTYLNGKMFKIWSADVIEGESSFAAGCAVNVNKKGFCVQTGEGLLKPLKVQLEGKKAMSCEDFLRGYKIEEGVSLGRRN